MKKYILCLTILFSQYVYSDIYENFEDGDYLQNPNWIGEYDCFAINKNHQLQSKSCESGFHYLSTESNINSNFEVSFWSKIGVVPSSNQLIRVYIISSNDNPLDGEGYYIQIGGTNRNITFNRQHNNKNTKLIENSDRIDILNSDNNEVLVKLETKNNAIYLYSMVVDIDNDYVEEGYCSVDYMGESNYCSVVYKNTQSSRNSFFLDNIVVKGDITNEGQSSQQENEEYGIQDEDVYSLVINEIMFDPLSDGQEYIELYNPLDFSVSLLGVSISTRNDEGVMRKGNKFPDNAKIPSKGYATLCNDRSALIKFHNIEDTVTVYSCSWSRHFPNTKSTIYLFDMDSVLIDSVYYDKSMHHPLLEETKGVSLERINWMLPSNNSNSWHSASTLSNYATPNALNSQYRNIENENNDSFDIYLDDDSFSPNGDGYKDVCVIHYSVPESGYVFNFRVFTPSGILVYSDMQNTILDESGVVIWDGRIVGDRVAQIGIYVLMCQISNPNNGKNYQKKLVISLIDK